MFNFPWTNFHELNLDWILSVVKEAKEVFDNGRSDIDYAVSTADEAKEIATQAAEATIADNSISTSKLQNGAVTNAKLANNSVTTANIVDRTIIGNDIAENTIESYNIKNGTIIGADIAENTITYDNLAAGSVVNSKIADNAVTTPKISDGSVTEAKLDSALASKIGGKQNVLVKRTHAFTGITGSADTNIVLSTTTAQTIGTSSSQAILCFYATSDAGMSGAVFSVGYNPSNDNLYIRSNKALANATLGFVFICTE